jgi:hypothetical protein
MPAPAVVPQGDSLRGVERLDIVEQIGHASVRVR